MAQAKKKQKPKAKQPWSGIALFNLGEDSEKGDRIRTIAQGLGLAVRVIKDEQLGYPVGYFAGLPSFKPSRIPFSGEVPSEEFMLMCGLSNQQFNDLLEAMKTADAKVGCKALVTQANRMWPVGTLISEVAREHALMNS